MNNKTSSFSRTSTRNGFTIIELMVSVALFIIVVGIASGTFVQALRTQRQVIALMAANDNASLTLEQMVREIRTSREFIANTNNLSFTNDFNETVTYALNEGIIERNGKPLTASNVLVKYITFIVSGGEVGDGKSTRVTILLGVSARGRMESFITRLQTTVVSRILDG